jgi:hypothetical protein
MKCAKCKCQIETDEETWVQGQALCQECWRKSLRKTWGWMWVLLGAVIAIIVLVFAAPILFFCITGILLAGRAGR